MTPRSGGPRGAPLVFTRGRTSVARLKVSWDHPVPELGQQPLPFADALAAVRGDDKRPAIVMRECHRCSGRDDALLSTSLSNEKTLVLARWFKCIKLPTHVVDPVHPFHALFDDERPPHLFLVSGDGSEVQPFDGTQTQSSLWRAMNEMLRRDYEKRPDASVKELLKLLDRFDSLDEEEETLKQRLDAAMISGGPKSAAVKKLLRKLNALQGEKKKTLERERALAELGLKTSE